VAQEPSSTSPLAASAAAADEEFSASVTAKGTAMCPNQGPETWIEIELYDAEGQPCADEPYRLTLANGELREGLRLDGQGRARHEDIPAGQCLVEFPEREPLLPEDNPKDAFEIELLDEHGEPAAGEPYLIILADGTRLEGKLDDHGKLRREGVAPGFFRLYLPERPKHRWTELP